MSDPTPSLSANESGPRKSKPAAKPLSPSREAQHSGVFGTADGDVARVGLRSLTPAEFSKLAAPKAPPRPEIPTPTSKSSPVVPVPGD
jgi:hypothetical protein